MVHQLDELEQLLACQTEPGFQQRNSREHAYGVILPL